VLKSFKLMGVSVPVCYNCDHLARTAKPPPGTPEELEWLANRT